MGTSGGLSGPDLRAGVKLDEVPDGGALVGHADGEAVMFVRHGQEVHAVGATCTHYGGPLAEGRLEDCVVTCPWHHARFDVRTGEAVGAPALNALPCFEVERRGELLVLGRRRAVADAPVVIVGAGAAGAVLAEELRKQGYAGAITLLGADPDAPVDRPNLSKDFLAGNAPEEWIPLRPMEHYGTLGVEVRRPTRVESLALAEKQVVLAGGERLTYGTLVLATGAEPIRLDLPGAERLLTLRELRDSRAIIAAAEGRRRAAVIGASFIGLEVAASLRTRGLQVDVVAPDPVPLARVLGEELGAFVKALHEEHGVRFHLGRKPARVDEGAVVLDDGATIAAELVVAGVGVRPRTELAERAGLRCERGVLVDERLRTSDPNVFAVGDIARYPDPLSGSMVRVEHWLVAERQAQSVARTLAGRGDAYRDVPFFWSQHYDVTINYVGHAERWDRVLVKGSVQGKDCLVGYEVFGRVLAVASIGRDRECLEAEAALRRRDFDGLRRLFD